MEEWPETAKTEFSWARQRAVVSLGVALSFIALRARGWWRHLCLWGTGGVVVVVVTFRPRGLVPLLPLSPPPWGLGGVIADFALRTRGWR